MTVSNAPPASLNPGRNLSGRTRRVFRAGQAGAGIAGLAMLSACSSAGTHGQVAAGYSTDYYIEHAAGNYQPPGPPSDPWGPYIHIASDRFDVPEPWIRQVMRVESGGHEYLGGQLTVSSAGAMGLMQLEPGTYQEMANRYSLGQDAFNPLDNILAGTAYIHEMYSVYGSPGFLAAYNAGPGRLDRYMDNDTPLPDATTDYIAMIAPRIQGYYPKNRSEADQLAMNTQSEGQNQGLLPYGVSPGAPAPFSPAPPTEEVAAIEPPAPVESAVYAPPPAYSAPAPTPPAPAQIAESAVYTPDAAPQEVSPPPAPVHHFALIQSAMADTPEPHTFGYGPSHGSGWAIQLGAYKSKEKANAAIGIAELSAVQVLMHGKPVVVSVFNGSTTRYRARVVGLPHDDAVNACERLSGGPTGCSILSPDAQS